ncbi:hypothetical protein BSLG_002005 [Batrachochytrium salamandrivorans]|nr:hypothetical protein BSLG_002005 [Batrachochytrium salamandrivorans]
MFFFFLMILTAEIERTLKKVAEGVEIFEGIFEKISTASNQAQKEKFEGDLKKEIKKLQRYRDQIKSWASSHEIKDKRALLENRKLIEQQMEKFKAMEKELKTKAYSQAGLNAASRVDPEEKEKEDLRQWISDMGDKLSVQIDMLEAELETLQIAVRKSKKGDSAKSERILTIDKLIERHKHHQTTLEIMLRMMDNGNLTPEEITNVQEDVAYYVEFNQEPDFEEDEGIYEGLNLEAEVYGFANEDDDDSNNHSDEGDSSGKPFDTPSAIVSHKEREVAPKSHVKERETDIEVKRKGSKNEHEAASPSKSKVVAHVVRSNDKVKDEAGKHPMIKPTLLPPRPTPSTPRSTAGPVPVDVPAPLAQRYAAAAAASTSGTEFPSKSAKESDNDRGLVNLATPTNIVASGRQTAATASAVAASTVVPQSEESRTKQVLFQQQPQSPLHQSYPLAAQAQLQKSYPRFVDRPSPSNSSFQSPSSARTPTPPFNSSSPTTSSTQNIANASLANDSFQDSAHLRYLEKQKLMSPSSMEPIDNRLPPSLADLVASFETAKERSQRPGDDSYFSRMVETSFQCITDSADSSKSKAFSAKDPYPVPSYYPQTPLAIFESNPLIFERFDIDTLFFIFYYRIGTYQQYLAARELKRQSWRFHKKYLTWFQRHEEPKAITDEFEQGTYVYFDYEDSWCQRKKTDFRFEYKYLEDEVQLQ